MNNEEEEVKPCPFCGGFACTGFNEYGKEDYNWYVVCTVCHARTGLYDRETAIEKWNKREYSWDILMEILDEFYPADIFSNSDSALSKDTGSQIVTKIREINELRGKVEISQIKSNTKTLHFLNFVGHQTLVAVEIIGEHICSGCFFEGLGYCNQIPCTSLVRRDGKNVIFRLAKGD